MLRERIFGRRIVASAALLARLAAFALILQISGLPTLIGELAELGDECCETPCEGADDEGHCPPNCHYGTCAKTITALLHGSAPLAGCAQPLPVMELAELIEAPTGFHHGVFHPPRA